MELEEAPSRKRIVPIMIRRTMDASEGLSWSAREGADTNRREGNQWESYSLAQTRTNFLI